MRVEFVDELPPRTVTSWKSGQIQDFADALRGAPGRWGKYPFPPGTRKAGYTKASQIRGGTYKAFPVGSFEAQYREGAVYVRYMGGAS